ncbi:hypothetical protein KC19_VG291400 [Ceratodon purpureus]|uniref:Uncharacterized protein n=1 Tax=Ceratodon purpureus TaxID=3225 RepID=A0A8T0HVP3_CERPU|nr:hypothetical protein KC19_VG291400 [Ceratodon purpureus]
MRWSWAALEYIIRRALHFSSHDSAWCSPRDIKCTSPQRGIDKV